MAKYVWHIASKADTLWMKWVNHIYLKGSDWWSYIPPQDCYWYWRKICAIKDRYAAGYVENGWQTKNGKYSIKSGYQ